MLKALESLQANISGAAGIVAGSAGGQTFDTSASNVNENPLSFMSSINDSVTKGLQDVFSFALGGSGLMDGLFDAVGGFASGIINTIGGWLGGSSSTSDEGIRIIGGEIGNLLNSVTVEAFKEVKSKSWAFGSTHTNTYFGELRKAGDEVGLVLNSLRDSVFEGATSLGISADKVNEEINKFNIATTKISLKGLSDEEQQEEIQAVFSKIFNDLAIAVVPFASEFKKVGEEIGTTLARMSAEVSIADFAVKNLGINLGDKLANPEMYVQIADNLSTMTGGIEDFASKMASFVDDFAPESVRFTLYSDALKDALSDVGLQVPATSEGFYNLMTTLDGTTSAGQEQIAALLNSQDVANSFYDLMEDRTEKFSNAVDSIYGPSIQSSVTSLNQALLAARGGNFSLSSELDLSNIAPSESDFSSIQDFNLEQAKIVNKLSELEKLTTGGSTVEDRALTAAQEQVTLLGSINTNIASASVPQVQQAQNNDNIVIELRAVRAEIAEMKSNSKTTSDNTKSSADSLQRLEIGGVEIRA